MYERYDESDWSYLLPAAGEPPLHWASPLSHEPLTVQGIDLTGTMVYITEPDARLGFYGEPSAIDPALPVTRRSDGPAPAFYVRSYHDFTPEQRHGYLAWIAGGRRAAEADRAFIRLYIQGLERRLLVDFGTDPLVDAELPFLAAELARLQSTYARWVSYDFAGGLLELLAVLQLGPSDEPPLPAIDTVSWEAPLWLRVGLGRFAAQKRPIPADWAAVWAWYRRDVVIRSALLRTPDEFEAVFAHHYTQVHGEGLTFRPGKKEVVLGYNATNPTLGPIRIQLDGIPDIFSRPSAGQKLRTLAEQTWADLGPYARAVNRTSRIDESLSMATLLPPILQSRKHPGIGEALRTLDEALGANTAAALSERDLVELWWPPTWDGSLPTHQLAPKDRKALIALLGRFGYGAEPDLRYGRRPGYRVGQGLTVFRAGTEVPEAPGPAWEEAVVAAQCAAAILALEGDLDEATAAHLAAEIAGTFSLHPTEAIRIQITLSALAASDEPVKITGLKGFIDPLPDDEREQIGDFTIDVATRYGTVSPQVVSLVQKIARMLGLNPQEVPSRLFGAMTRSSAPTQPTAQRPTRQHTSRQVSLDHTAIAATEAATAVVSSLLGEIFADDDHTAAHHTPAPEDAGTTVAGLDAVHSAMLRAMAAAETTSWSPEALESLAQGHHLMGLGAIDTLNDAALDLAGDPLLLEGDGSAFTIDEEVLATLLASESA